MTASRSDTPAADTASSHVTPPDGNVFADIGFDAVEAQTLLQAADARINDEAETTRLLAELLESAADLHEHGVIGARGLRRLLDEVADANLRAKVLARLPERAKSVFVDIDEL